MFTRRYDGREFPARITHLKIKPGLTTLTDMLTFCIEKTISVAFYEPFYVLISLQILVSGLVRVSDVRLTFNYLSIGPCKVCVNDLLAGLGQDNSGMKIPKAAPYKCTQNVTAAQRINSSSFSTALLVMKLC